jgi:hypothetical protein
MNPRVVACAIAFATLLAGLASAQAPASQPSPSSPAVQPTPTPSDTSSQATLYFYRYKQFVGSALSPSVYCDDAELARMDNGKYFTVRLAPGHHTFRSNDKQSGIELDLKPGEKDYIRVEIATGLAKGHGRLVSVAPDQGTYEIKKLKPLESNKVKDTQHVSIAEIGN